MTTLFETNEAVISDNMLYRYQLTRRWDGRLPVALFWMLNPSTADARRNDPTICRCMSFARREGCGGIIVVNWFGWRTSDPAELPMLADPVGHENRWWIQHSIEQCDGPLIAAWGACRMVDSRLAELADLIGSRELKCLGTTKDGRPRHPLYVRADQALVAWEGGVAK